jgi:glycerol-3-phosphate dehydrogenase
MNRIQSFATTVRPLYEVTVSHSYEQNENINKTTTSSFDTKRVPVMMDPSSTAAAALACTLSNNSTYPLYDLIVIGGGVVGLACLRAATLQGWKCALVEQEAHVLSHASGSNSGIACTGVDAVPGSLERALIRDANSQFRIYCKKHNVPTRTCGSLVCQWAWNENETVSSLQSVLEESNDAGDTHATLLSGERVLTELEPNLSPECLGAVHIPGEIVVDPWVYSISLAVHALENGAHIYTNFEVDLDDLYFDGDVWTVRQPRNNGHVAPLELRAKAVINAAGIWSDKVQSAMTSSSSSQTMTKKWTAKPRRGQYRVYNSNSHTHITHPIQPIPTQRTKGIFVFSTIHNQLVVGPTAEDQESRTDRSIRPQVADELDNYIQKVIPNLNVKDDFVGEYVGIRPGTNQRDYQIHVFPKQHWIAVAGIRSTGLTASLGIGNYVMRQLYSILEPPKSPLPSVKTTPLPSLEDMVQDFRQHDGYVSIHGNKFRVTHPLSIFGMQSLAASNKLGDAQKGQSRL